jgi:DNA-binding NarL/FixJ family response regulator
VSRIHKIGLLALQPARWFGAAGQYLARTEAEDFRFLSERDVLAMISQGFSNKCIARALEISRRQ